MLDMLKCLITLFSTVDARDTQLTKSNLSVQHVHICAWCKYCHAYLLSVLCII